MTRPFLVLVAVAAITSACTGPSASLAPGQTAGQATPAAVSTSAVDVASARAFIDAANLGDSATITPIQDIRFTPAGTLAAAQRLAEGVEGDALWAAAWVYATAGTDPAPLLPLLANDDPTIRAIASAGVASLGRPEGLDALAELISVDAGLRGSLPPVSVARYATYTLSGLIDGAADSLGNVSTGTPDERSAAAAVWTSWLEANRARITFDQEQHAWKLQ